MQAKRKCLMIRSVSSSVFLLLMVGLCMPQPVSALPAGFQEFYLPLPTGTARSTQPYDGTYSIFNHIEPPIAASRGMHYVVGLTASADNTVVYYDHWENGLGTGTSSDEIVSLNKGQVHYFESGSIPVPRGTGTYYDGGDRVFVSGSLLQLTASTWTEDEGTVFADAWEVYPVQAWENSYTVPVGENLAGAPTYYRDFTYVFALVMSGSDSNSIVITDPSGPGSSVTLNRGKTHIYQVRGSGTKIVGSGVVQVQLVVGRRDTSGWEMRGYTLAPQSYWGSGYYSSVPSWSSSARSELYLYNPNTTSITVNYQDLTGTGSFTIAAGATRSYSSGTGHYIPINSGVYLYTPSGEIFWGIGSGDTGSATYDWGYSLIPINFLGTDNYLSWAPGTSNRIANGSPVYVTAVNDNTTVLVDYGPNDGVFDTSYRINRLQAIQIFDPDNDNSGMHIVSTAPVAVAWGESPNRAGTGNPYLDMGYTTLPLPVEWIDITLQIEKTANPVEITLIGDPGGWQTQFTIVVNVPGTAGAPVGNIDLVDYLAPGWEYVAGSGNPSDPTGIAGDIAGGYVLTWDVNWTINQGSSQTITFNARATSSVDISNPNRNVAAVTGQSVGATLTADDDAFVAVIQPLQYAQVRAAKVDTLFIDADGNSEPSSGDTILYTVAISNNGNAAAQNVTFEDIPDLNTSLVEGTVTVSGSPGSIITSGNNHGDVMVGVDIGDLPAGDSVVITFEAVIGSDGFTAVSNQGTVVGSNFDSALTDDPDTPGLSDPTVTPITIVPPVLGITKFGPAQAIIGSSVTYTGTLTNDTQSTAYNAVLIDYLPTGATFISSSHTATYDPGPNTVTWHLGNIAPGVSIPGWVAVHIEDTVADGSLLTNTFSLTWEDYQGNSLGPATASSDTIAYTHPQIRVEKTGATEASPGESFPYTIEVTNVGGMDAVDVTVVDYLPTEVSYVGSSPSGVYSAGPPAMIEWNLGTVASGDSISITVTVEVDGSIVHESYALNTANAIWKDLSENPYGPETSEWQTRVDVDPELAIVKEGPAATTNDSDMIYTITLSNIGTGPAYDVILLDQLPPWTSFVSSSHTAVYNVESNAVDWNLGTLPAGTSITVSVTVHVDQAAPGGTHLNNAISATGEDSSGDPLDPAEASWDTTVYTHPLLTIEKGGPAIAYPGDTLEYTIVVKNTGGSDAFDVVVVDDLPIGFGYHGSAPAGMHSDGIVMWSLGTVPVSGSVEIKVSATVEAGFTDQTMLINTTGALWGDFLDRSWGPIYTTAETTIYGRQGGGGAVGLDVYPVNKLVVMAPWIILFMALIGVIIAIARYGRVDSN